VTVSHPHIHWKQAYIDLDDSTPTPPREDWDIKLVSNAIALYKGIWDDKNSFIHGKSRAESWQNCEQDFRDRLVSFINTPLNSSSDIRKSDQFLLMIA